MVVASARNWLGGQGLGGREKFGRFVKGSERVIGVRGSRSGGEGLGGWQVMSPGTRGANGSRVERAGGGKWHQKRPRETSKARETPGEVGAALVIQIQLTTSEVLFFFQSTSVNIQSTSSQHPSQHPSQHLSFPYEFLILKLIQMA